MTQYTDMQVGGPPQPLSAIHETLELATEPTEAKNKLDSRLGENERRNSPKEKEKGQEMKGRQRERKKC